MASTYRPEIAWPAELAQEDAHFASGVNHRGEVRGLIGRHFGIAANQIRSGLLEEIEALAGGMTEVFIDSGAFAEVAFCKRAKRLVVKKPITDAQWEARFEIYLRLARALGRHVRVVAPDLVGDQKATLARLERWALHVAACAALGAQIIVPVQKGALPMSEMFRRSCEILGLRETPIAGIPMKKDATSLADLAELVDSLPWFGARIHLLGLGPESKRYAAVIRCIKSRRPNAVITSDSVTIRRLVGRKNGRGGGPRALTKYQDEARANGMTDTADIKEYGLGMHCTDERDREIERANALGWYDTELFDSLEEAVEHHARCKRERDLPDGQLELALPEAA